MLDPFDLLKANGIFDKIDHVAGHEKPPAVSAGECLCAVFELFGGQVAAHFSWHASILKCVDRRAATVYDAFTCI